MNKILHHLNGKYHSLYLKTFNVILLSHLAEHVFQIFQLYVLHWPRPQCLGLLGLWKSWLVTSEWLHYSHALFMVVGLALLLPAITHPKARFYWKITFILAFLHHIEHFLLLEQAITHKYLFVGTLPTPPGHLGVPISFGQILFPKLGIEIFKQRIELHLFYNLVVMLPYWIALNFYKNIYEKKLDQTS